MITPILISSCSHFDEGQISREANDLFNQGKYEASLSKYKNIIEKHPVVADRVLFEMGIIYAHPRNPKKDYQKSLEYFQKILEEYPDSAYRRDSQMMIFQIHNVINKDKIIAKQQTQIETSWQGVKSRENEIITLQEKIETLEEQIEAREEQIETLEQNIFALRTGPADKVLIEKKERQLTLLSKDEVIKTYKIALGGNPVGPKERQGDNKTPEGTYIIDSRNRNSDYHLSLRAKELGVSPGGDIMIHGIKNGLAWVGALHAGIDWTNGCIAVTDEEMEEIYKLVPNGTIVEIRP
jgi:tetratricopeptide (TPR) repeat protein